MAVYHVVPAGCDPALHSWRVRWPAFDDLPDIREDVLAEFFEPMEKTQTYLLGDRGHVCKCLCSPRSCLASRDWNNGGRISMRLKDVQVNF